MADTRTTTAPNGAEPFDELASPDGLEFRNTLDLLFAALRAEAAAARMLETIPEQTPKATSVSLHGAHILSMAKKHKKVRPGLADLLEEAFCLLEAYSANLVVMSLR